MEPSVDTESTNPKADNANYSKSKKRKIPLHCESNLATDIKGRTIIHVTDFEYDTIHNLLYFLYTGYVNMHDTIEPVNSDFQDEHYDWTPPAGYPQPVDAFDLYRAADMYLIEDLKKLVSRFIAETCTLDDIYENLFNMDKKPFKEIVEIYLNYIAKNFDLIKGTEMWDQKVRSILSESTPDELQYRSEVLLSLTKFLHGKKVPPLVISF